MNIIFIYKRQPVIIQCNSDDIVPNIIKKFIVKTDLDSNNLSFIFEEKHLNIKEKKRVNELYKSINKNNKDNNIIIIKVYQKDNIFNNNINDISDDPMANSLNDNGIVLLDNNIDDNEEYCLQNLFEDNKEKEILIKTFLIIIIQFLVVIFYLFLDIYVDLSRIFIKSKASIISCFVVSNKITTNEIIFLNINHCIHVPCTIIYFSLSFKFIKKKYIIIIFGLILLYYVSLEICSLLCKKIRLWKFIIGLL